MMKHIVLMVSYLSLTLCVTAEASQVKKLDLACVYETDSSPTGMKILNVIVVNSDQPIMVRTSSRSNRRVALKTFATVMERHWETNKVIAFYVLPPKLYKLIPHDLNGTSGNFDFYDNYRKAKYTCSVNQMNYPKPRVVGSN